MSMTSQRPPPSGDLPREWLREGLHIADAWIVLFNLWKAAESGGYDNNSHLSSTTCSRKMPRFAPTPMDHDIPSEICKKFVGFYL